MRCTMTDLKIKATVKLGQRSVLQKWSRLILIIKQRNSHLETLIGL